MKVITKKYKVFKFEELTEEAQEKVYSDFRKDDYYPWHDENVKSLEAFCKAFSLNYRDVDFEYGYKNFIIYKEEVLDIKGIRLFKYLTNNYSKIIKQFEGIEITGYYMDYAVIKPMAEFLKRPSKNMEYDDLIDDCLNSWLEACIKDYEHYYSEENIKETISCNEYEFLEDGSIFI